MKSNHKKLIDNMKVKIDFLANDLKKLEKTLEEDVTMEKKNENPRITEYKNARDHFVFRDGVMPVTYQDEGDDE